MTKEEILLFRLSGQHLVSPSCPLAVVKHTCGLQAQYLSHALHALSLRSGTADTRGMVKTWANRGTMHLIAEEDLPLFLHRDRTHFLRPADTMESDDKVSASRKHYFAELILTYLESGSVTREELRLLCRHNGMTDMEETSLFDPWGGLIRALCESGRLCHEISEEKTYRLCPSFEPMDAQPARLELARRYFTHFGPATIRDAAYFFGSTQKAVKQWLDQLPVQETEHDGKTYFHIPATLSPAVEIPPCLFLSGFDPFLLGYEKKESLILAPEDIRSIFTLSGIVRPAVLLHGQVVGWWNLKNHKLTVTCFRPCDKSLLRWAAETLWPELRSISIIQ